MARGVSTGEPPHLKVLGKVEHVPLAGLRKGVDHNLS